jgi:4-carboxymuconolactone decarboxylase
MEEPMRRVDELPLDTLTPEQRRIHDEIAGPRSGTASGPFAIWLRVPAIADAANRLGNTLRMKSRFERRLFELMVLVVARHWSAQYAWRVHEEAALAGGLSPAVIAAIRDRRRPDFEREDERLIYDTITELTETKTLSAASYERAVAGLGLDLLIELVAGAGFYAMVAMTLGAFDVPPRGGGRPLP